MGFTHAVLSASGFRVAAFFGALHALAPLLHDVRHFAGSSGGALAAFVFCAGVDPREAADIVATSFGDPARGAHVIGSLRATAIAEAWSACGLASPDHVERMLRDMLERRLGVRRATLREFAQASGRVLSVWSTNLATGSGQALTLETHPELDVVTAVLASISIPFVYRPVDIGGQPHVDGAVTEFLPEAAFFDVPQERVLRVSIPMSGAPGAPFMPFRDLMGLAAAVLSAAVRHRASVATLRGEALILDVEPAYPIVGADRVLRFDVDAAKVWRQYHAGRDAAEAWAEKKGWLSTTSRAA